MALLSANPEPVPGRKSTRVVLTGDGPSPIDPPSGCRSLPAIVRWTPYESTGERFIGWGVWFARRGYAAVVVDVRGRYESEGRFTAWTHDGQDAHDTLTWAAGEQWSNG